MQDEPIDPDEPVRYRVRSHGQAHLDDGQRSPVIARASFAATLGLVRALRHWVRDGHGPAGGGMSFGGRHFHHYNIGIALLIDLEDVYRAKQGRTSVDLAVGVIALGGLGVAGSSFWPSAARELRPRSRPG